jgi:hypothetical protein
MGAEESDQGRTRAIRSKVPRGAVPAGAVVAGSAKDSMKAKRR